MTVLRVADGESAWTAVRLVTDLWKREPPRPLSRDGDGWTIELGALPVDRLEFLLEVERTDGTAEWICAPGWPTVEQPFGAKSVLELDGYRAPRWLAVEAPAGHCEALAIDSSRLGGVVTGSLWSAAGLAGDTSAPLIVALDGPEYARFASLDRFLAAAIATATLPPLRVALLAPRARDEDYSASEAFAEALAHELVPAIAARASCTTRVGLGASLGGLAILHAHRRAPSLFDALILQSGSFFDDVLDAHERGYRWFDRIAAFVRERATPGRPIPIAMTCGTGEENLADNRAMAHVLATGGDTVSLHEVRDGHTWTCWRDGFEVAFASIVRALIEPAPTSIA